MKKGWQTKTLGEACEVIAGQSPEGKFYNAEGNGMPFYQGKKDFGDKFIEAPTTWTTQTTKIAKEGDILMSVRAPVGPVNFATDEVCIGRGLAAIRSSAALNRDFLFYQLWHLQPEIAGREGAVFASINKAEIEALPLAVAPLTEQQRIVGLLDEAFEDLATAKANAEKNLQNARAIFESHLQSVFTQRSPGWVDSTIGEVIKFIDYRGKTPVKTASGVRLITAKNVKMGYLQESPMEFIAAASYIGWMTRGIPQKGDVLFTTEAPLANVAQLDTDEKVAFAQRIIIMQPNAAKLDSTFLKYLLLSQPVQQRIRTKGTGATVQGIKASLLKLIEISFPKSLAPQEKIVSKLDDLREETQRLAAIYSRKHAALEALKKSLLHQAFTGGL
jgi:type I restriction enzyme, S subunit